jgi:hypothetical protein
MIILRVICTRRLHQNCQKLSSTKRLHFTLFSQNQKVPGASISPKNPNKKIKPEFPNIPAKIK